MLSLATIDATHKQNSTCPTIRRRNFHGKFASALQNPMVQNRFGDKMLLWGGGYVFNNVHNIQAGAAAGEYRGAVRRGVRVWVLRIGRWGRHSCLPFALGPGITYSIRDRVSLFANYDLQFNIRQTIHVASGGIQFQW